MQFTDHKTPQKERLCYLSSYDRGLEHLLYMWTDIKEKYPKATLHIAYGWENFDKLTQGNPERAEWKRGMELLMQQEGIFHHGRLSKQDLKELRQHCSIWAYPTHFYEIFCITAVEAQVDGLIPVTCDVGSIKEVVRRGHVLDVDIYTKEGRQEYLKVLLDEMATNKPRKDHFSKDHKIEEVANKWIENFDEEYVGPKVSIITPTIRQGFGNMMANNLSIQTYQNFEWIIVDDFPEDRSEHFAKLAKQYILDIKYVRGQPTKIKRRFALAAANNTGYKTSTGDLLVILQDFILIPEDGIEQITETHKHYPNCLIAPVDVQAFAGMVEDTNSEDWYNGNTYPVGKIDKQNVRIQNKGLRKTIHPMDFEQNYCGIPRKIIDDLGGWYELMDEGLGFDNTEFAWRAMQAGYEILIDELNVAICLDHWTPLMDKPKQLGEGRERSLNDPRYLFLIGAIEDGKLPLKVTQEVNDTIDLQYEMPENVDPTKWIRKNAKDIATKWLQDTFYK